MTLQIFRTNEFECWLESQPVVIRARVLARLDLLSMGHFGNHKRFSGLIELRWRNGIRLYAALGRNRMLFILLGGTKHDQKRDIQKALQLKEKTFEKT